MAKLEVRDQKNIPWSIFSGLDRESDYEVELFFFFKTKIEGEEITKYWRMFDVAQ